MPTNIVIWNTNRKAEGVQKGKGKKKRKNPHKTQRKQSRQKRTSTTNSIYKRHSLINRNVKELNQNSSWTKVSSTTNNQRRCSNKKTLNALDS